MKKFSATGHGAGDEAGAGGVGAPGGGFGGGGFGGGGSHSGRNGADQQSAGASHVEILKALAEPLRLNMMYALARSQGSKLPAMTVKELAAELGEPQTKLYRHIKHLEAAGLIRAVSSRVVSGIVEQRYQASEPAMVLGDNLTDSEKISPEAEAMATAALELYRRQFFAERRADPPGEATAEPAPHRRAFLAIADGWIPAARAAQIYDQLHQLLDEIVEAEDAPEDPAADDLVPVNVLLGYFSPKQPR